MEPFLVVDLFDKSFDVSFCFRKRSIFVQIHLLVFERPKETLDLCVLITHYVGTRFPTAAMLIWLPARSRRST